MRSHCSISVSSRQISRWPWPCCAMSRGWRERESPRPGWQSTVSTFLVATAHCQCIVYADRPPPPFPATAHYSPVVETQATPDPPTYADRPVAGLFSGHQWLFCVPAAMARPYKCAFKTERTKGQPKTASRMLSWDKKKRGGGAILALLCFRLCKFVSFDGSRLCAPAFWKPRGPRQSPHDMGSPLGCSHVYIHSACFQHQCASGYQRRDRYPLAW
ncbi:hypothetical protein BD289DRAFT_132346 [Coniella lustricola]|uniref:Uncharacterized protein n=1 Tax=Coniella lustricola TaxID=2025994 RepID=A0A2T2ZVX8_9PEZI|nr:hypothetical protein BD289DRAFT_132346 [Coniella lustricola]